MGSLSSQQYERSLARSHCFGCHAVATVLGHRSRQQVQIRASVPLATCPRPPRSLSRATPAAPAGDECSSEPLASATSEGRFDLCLPWAIPPFPASPCASPTAVLARGPRPPSAEPGAPLGAACLARENGRLAGLLRRRSSLSPKRRHLRPRDPTLNLLVPPRRVRERQLELVFEDELERLRRYRLPAGAHRCRSPPSRVI
jgi:hypothetical protein